MNMDHAQEFRRYFEEDDLEPIPFYRITCHSHENVVIDRPPPIVAIARTLHQADWRFFCQDFDNGIITITCRHEGRRKSFGIICPPFSDLSQLEAAIDCLFITVQAIETGAIQP